MAFILLIIFSAYSTFWLYRAYQIGIKHQINLVKDWGGKPLQNAEKYQVALASVYLVSGLAMASTTLALVVAKAPLKYWWILVVLGQCYIIAHQFIALRAKKNAS